MEHISTIVQDALDHAAEQIECEAPQVAEQIRAQLEQIVEFPMYETSEKMRLVS